MKIKGIFLKRNLKIDIIFRKFLQKKSRTHGKVPKNDWNKFLFELCSVNSYGGKPPTLNIQEKTENVK